MEHVQEPWRMASLVDRVAVVTGGARGIGLGMAKAFLAEGARVVLADIDPQALELAEMTLAAPPGQVLSVVTDVSKCESVRRLADAALARFGTIDVVCNNAGVWTLGYQWETPDEDWRWVLDVNLWGVIHCIRVFIPQLIANPGGGQVVNTASIGGLVAGAGTGPYAASKHAVVGLSKSLRAELAMRQARVGVTIVCPGRVATSIAERGNTRPGAQGPRTLPTELEATAAAMRAADGEMNPDDAGSMIIDAIKANDGWVFPGADRHLPLVKQDFADLLAAFPPAAAERRQPR
jgi:NAD(P)-dependent dehydrogenase (short-subunit alcohol dehydrogenase family)